MKNEKTQDTKQDTYKNGERILTFSECSYYRDQRVIQEQLTWPVLVSYLKKHSETETSQFLERYRTTFEQDSFSDKDHKTGLEKARLPMILPAVFAGNTKAPADVLGWNLLILDFDVKDLPRTKLNYGGYLVELKERFKRYDYILHSTGSNSDHMPRFRVIIPLNETLQTEHISHLWNKFVQEHKLDELQIDPTCREHSRQYFTPAKFPNAKHLFYSNPGEPIDVQSYTSDFEKVQEEDKRAQEMDQRVVADDVQNEDLIECLDVIAEHSGTGTIQPYWRKIGYIIASVIGVQDATTLMKKYFGEWEKNDYSKVLFRGYDKSKSPKFPSLVWITRQYNPDFEPKNSKSTYRLTDIRKVDLDINFYGGVCGTGKTYQTLGDIAKEGGVWLYALDKIEPTFEERMKEFDERCNDLKVSDFSVHHAHSKKPIELSVAAQIKMIRTDINKSSSKNHVVFITHDLLMMTDWCEWTDTELVIDEATNIWCGGQNNFRESHEFVFQYFENVGVDGDCYILQPSEMGEKLLKSNRKDNLTSVFKGLLKLANRTNGQLWVKRKSLDEPESTEFQYFGLLEPDSLTDFKEITVLGDSFETSILYKVWKDRHQVNWIKQNLRDPLVRTTPISERMIVKYFDEERDASAKTFKDYGRTSLKQISKYINGEHKPKDMLITTNDTFLKTVQQNLKGTYITPRAHGSNKYKEFSVCVWLATMKPSVGEANLLREVSGMDMNELILDRDYNSMFQFIFRGNIRVFDIDDPCIVYVYSKKQAEYLKARTGCKIEFMEGVIEQRPIKNGAPTKLASPVQSLEQHELHEQVSNAMTDAERSKKGRLKKSGLSEDQALGVIGCMRLGMTRKKAIEEVLLDDAV